MWYIGVDAHKHKCWLTAKLADGTTVARRSFAHSREGWTTALAEVPKGSKVALECVGWYAPIVTHLESLGFEAVLAHARDIALIAKSRKKTDERDSDILADLLRTNFLPRSYVPDKNVRELRELTRTHDIVTKEATAVKNRIHRLLERAWIETPDTSDLFGKNGRQFLASVELERTFRVLLDAHLRMLDALEAERGTLSREIAKRVRDDEDVNLLLTIDGLGILSAATLKAEIADATRFPNRYAIRANFGMSITVRDSADTQRRGHITKQGNGNVRRVLGQGALAFKRTNPGSNARFESIRKKRGTKVAKVGTMNDLLDTIYQMLKTRTSYRYSRPDLVATKRANLARLAGGPELSSLA